jgi:nuclear GTP-binding protein
VAPRSDLGFFADLIPKEVAEKWLKYLREELPTVAFKCSTQQQRSNLGHTRKSKSQTMTATTSECLGAETLLQLLKNYSRNNKVNELPQQLLTMSIMFYFVQEL